MLPPKPIISLCVAVVLLITFHMPLLAQKQTVINGEKTQPINFPSACAYTWTNDNPNIGLPASGTGNIAAFTAVNNGSTPIVAKIKATPVPNLYAYVPNNDDNSVSVIDLSSSKATAIINVDKHPIGTIVSPDGNRLYVSHQESNTVLVINTSNNQIIKSVPVGWGASGMVITPDGKYVYVADINASTISVINTIDYTVKTIGVASNPFILAIHPNGKNVYTYNHLSRAIEVLSTTSNTIVASLPVGPYIEWFKISPDGERIYFGEPYTNKIYAYDLAAKTIVAQLDIGLDPSGFDITPDGKKIIATHAEESKVSIISTADFKVITTLDSYKWPGFVTISPDGKLAYVSNLISGDITVVNMQSNTALTHIPIGGYPAMVSFAEVSTCSPVEYTITVNPTPPPGISASPNNLPAFITTYGTPSVASSFNVSGVSTKAGIVVTPPPGFEVSSNNSIFSNTITIGAAGNIPSTPVYIRLSGKVPVSSYSGDVVVASTGLIDIKVAIPASMVTRAPLNIIADNKTKTEGASNPILTATYVGLVNNETAVILTAQPVLNTDADEFSPVGQYPINISGAAALNYTITYQNGVLTVKPPIKGLIIPNAFSPNGDGINDTWQIKNLDTYANATLEIFNRSGVKLYTTSNVPWDGTHNGGNVPAGTYFYMITIKDKFKILSGNVTLLR